MESRIDGEDDAVDEKAAEDGAEEVRTRIVNDGSSFGELAVLGLRPVSLVTVATRTACAFDRIQQDALFGAFAGLPEVLRDMKARARGAAPGGYRAFYS